MDFSTLEKTMELIESSGGPFRCCCVLALGFGGAARGAQVECLGGEFSIKSVVSEDSLAFSPLRHAALACCRAFAAAFCPCQLSHQSSRAGAGGLPGFGFGAIARE